MRTLLFARAFLPKLLALCLLLVQGVDARSIAFTFDDGPDMSDNVGMTAIERNSAILEQLAAAKVKSVLFVTHTDDDERRIALLRQWGEQGHMYGQPYSHTS